MTEDSAGILFGAAGTGWDAREREPGMKGVVLSLCKPPGSSLVPLHMTLLSVLRWPSSKQRGQRKGRVSLSRWAKRGMTGVGGEVETDGY